MSKEVLTELGHKKEVYKRWKQGQVTQDEYRAPVQSCRDGVRKPKVGLELNLERDVKGSNKRFYKYINSKKMTRENTGLLLNGAGELVKNDMEKAKMLNAAFVSVFTSKNGFWESQAPEAGKVWYKGDLDLVEENQVREQLSRLDIHKSIGSDGLHP